MKKHFRQTLSLIMSFVMIMSVFAGIDGSSFINELMSVTANASYSGIEWPVTDLSVDKVTINEYTNGYWRTYTDEETGETIKYFEYDLDQLFNNFTVTFSDGTVIVSDDGSVEYNGEVGFLEVDYYFDVTQFRNPLSAGTHEIPVQLGENFTKAILEIVSAGVTINVEPLTVIENTEGYWTQRYNYETDSYTDIYIYNFDFDYTVTLADGTELAPEYAGGSIYYEGEYYFLDEGTNQYNNPLEVGTHEIPVTIFGGSAMATVEIIETPVASVEINPVKMFENSNGYWSERYESTGDYEEEGKWVEYYEYNIEYNGFTVTLKDGTVLTSESGYIYYNDEQHFPEEINSQNDNPLTLGSNKIEVSLLGFRTTADIEIIKPAQKLVCEPITMIKNLNGQWADRYNEETEEEESFFYYYFSINDFTVTMDDGTELVSENGRVTFNGKQYRPEIASQYEKPLVVGVNEIPVSIMGCESTVTVEIIETPIESIVFSPLTIIENTNGTWENVYDYETDEYKGEFFIYNLNDLESTVTMKDGSVFTLNQYNSAIEYNGKWVSYDQWTVQRETPLSFGKNEIELSLLGYTATAQIEIIESPVASVVVEPVYMRENVGGNYGYIYNEETGTEERCYLYDIEPIHFDFVVTLKDGTTLRSQNGTIEYDGKTYWCEYNYSDAPFELGTNTLDCRVLGYNVPVTFVVKENPTLGDVNYDKYTTSYDAMLVMVASAKLTELDETSTANADVDKDGKLTALDARKILRVSAMLENGDEFAAVRTYYNYLNRNPNTEIYLEYDECISGEEFKVAVKTRNVSGIHNANVFLTYNTNVLEFVSIENSIEGNGRLFAGDKYSDGKISMAVAFTDSATEDFEVATITFKVLSAGEHYMTIDIAEWLGNEIPYNYIYTIFAKSEKTEEPTTKEPETEVPTTEPTTKEPETEVPTTEPTTEEPTTEEPTTEEPTTEEPTTEVPTTEEPTTEVPTTEEPTTEEPTTEEPTTEEPTTEEPTTEEPTTEEPTTKEPETEVPTTEPTTKEPETEPTTKDPVTQAPTTEKPTEKPTEAPTQKPVSDKLEVKDDTVKVDNTSKVSTVKTKSSANDILKSVKNEKVSIVDKDGKAVSGDALVGTGAKIQIKDNSGKVISTYTVCIPTDVDGNGKTTAADARLALRGSAKLDKVEGVYATASDMNTDGKITAADARMILRISAGLEKA